MSKGIDIPISDLILMFNTFLWTSNNNSFNGRIKREELKEGYSVKIRPLIYSANGKYTEVLRNDNYDSQCFVDVLPNADNFSTIKEVKVNLMFMINADKLYPTLTDKNEQEEQIVSDIEKYISMSPFKQIQEIRGYAAFNDYGWKESGTVNLKDFLIRFDLKLLYNN